MLRRANPRQLRVPHTSRLSSTSTRQAPALRERRRLGNVVPAAPIPVHILKPDYALNPAPLKPVTAVQYDDLVKLDSEGIKRMRESGQLAKEVLRYASSLAVPGATTHAIDRLVQEMIVSKGAYPSPLAYGLFPRAICTSINDVAVHGIPDDVPIEEGDLLKIDVTVYLNGYHGDTCTTLLVGNKGSIAAKRLLETAYKCRAAGIDACGPGRPFSAIGEAVEDIAEQFACSVISPLSGHGIGKKFHSDPYIFHVRNAFPGHMSPGNCFTIEPVIAEGSPEIFLDKDEWTVRTADGMLAAQFEHTVLITDNGAEALTA